MESGQIFKGMLLVSDIDGTLTELTEIPQNNIEAINRFIALGGTFTLCTGRPKCALAEILPQLKVIAPIITINGGYIYSPQDDTVLFGAELPESVRDFVFALLERFAQVGAMLVEPDNYWVIRWGDESIEGVAQRRDMYMREGCCRMYLEEEGPKRWHKVVLIVPPEQIPTVRAYVEEQNPQGFYPVPGAGAAGHQQGPRHEDDPAGAGPYQNCRHRRPGERQTDAGTGGFFRRSQKRRPRSAKRG